MSEYTGHVEPGGATATRTIDIGSATAQIRKLSVGPMDNNAYLICDPSSSTALLIDAANDAHRILTEVEGLDLVAIATTHGHGDHWQALVQVRATTSAPALLHPADRSLVPWSPDGELVDGEAIRVGALEVRVLSTPGHTEGSTCLVLGDHLFTGDTLFPGGPGNTFGNGAAFQTIMRSLRERLFVLPDDVWVYPGHGDDTTLGRERPALDEWAARGW